MCVCACVWRGPGRGTGRPLLPQTCLLFLASTGASSLPWLWVAALGAAWCACVRVPCWHAASPPALDSSSLRPLTGGNGRREGGDTCAAGAAGAPASPWAGARSSRSLHATPPVAGGAPDAASGARGGGFVGASLEFVGASLCPTSRSFKAAILLRSAARSASEVGGFLPGGSCGAHEPSAAAPSSSRPNRPLSLSSALSASPSPPTPLLTSASCASLP